MLYHVYIYVKYVLYVYIFVTLRLLMDMARSKPQKLFLIFIDISKAYDLVPMDKLLKILKNLGCGFTVLAAIATIYWYT